MQHLAEADVASLLTAAEFHSRLQQAARAALDHITVSLTEQQQADNISLYLERYGRHVDSFHLRGDEDCSVTFGLPGSLKPDLSSLLLHRLKLQFGHGTDQLSAALDGAALKYATLNGCELQGDVVGRALREVLSQLTGLDSLGLRSVDSRNETEHHFVLTTGALERLPLKCIVLGDMWVQGPPKALVLQPLHYLSRLVHLELVDLKTEGGYTLELTANMLSGAGQLTTLTLKGVCETDENEDADCDVLKVEPSVLAGKTMLQELTTAYCHIVGEVAGVGQLLANMQHLAQLKCIWLRNSMRAVEEGTTQAAAFAALTASSQLQLLDIGSCVLPAGVWQHTLPTGRQLSSLTRLDIAWAVQPSGDAAPAPEGSRLVSCCPELTSLDIRGLEYRADMPVSLKGLSELHTLRMDIPGGAAAAKSVKAVCQLNGLRELELMVPDGEELPIAVMQLTKLELLTALVLSQPENGVDKARLIFEVRRTMCICLVCDSVVASVWAKRLLRVQRFHRRCQPFDGLCPRGQAGLP